MASASKSRLMSGTHVARAVLAETAARAARFKAATGRAPHLAAVLVGEDPSSLTYVRMKRARCDAVGIDSTVVSLDASSTTGVVVEAISRLSGDPLVDGILLQHPLPDQVAERAAFEAIAPEKDVDGVTMHSFAAMAFGQPGFTSCTPAGILALLDAYDVPLPGQRSVVIGRSAILGKPVAMLLLARDATVTMCHSRTTDLAAIVRDADVVVAAVGRPAFVRGDWLKPGAVVIDAGYNDGNVGDVAFAEAVNVARLITAVPGGVGPMTIAMLLRQTLDAAEQALRDERGDHDGVLSSGTE